MREAYLRDLPERLAKVRSRSPKRRAALVKFNRWEPEASGKFTFLGFDFYWATHAAQPEHGVVRRRTNRKKFRASLRVDEGMDEEVAEQAAARP